MSPFASAVFAIVMITLCVGIAFAEYRKTHEVISPLLLFLGLAIVDIFLPGALYSISQGLTVAPWLSADLVSAQISTAMFVFAIAIALFAVGYAAVHLGVQEATGGSPVIISVSRRLAYAVLAVAGAWWVWSLWFRAGDAGGLLTYIRTNLIYRWDPSPVAAQFPEASYPVTLGLQIAPTMLTVFTMMTAVLFFSRPRPLGVEAFALPGLALLASSFTFFRGSILIYFLSLATIVEARAIGISGKVLRILRSKHVEALLTMVLGTGLFFAYGVMRNTFQISTLEASQVSAAPPSPVRSPTSMPVVTASNTVVVPPFGSPFVTSVPVVTSVPGSEAPNVVSIVTSAPTMMVAPNGTPFITSVPVVTTIPRTASPTQAASATPVPIVGVSEAGVASEAARALRGEGLVGLASILAYYPSHYAYLGGKTIRDILLLPVPRAIWKDKPAWYGVSDITRTMGEPTSTQSAVTMPGELYANFGPPGLLGMVIYGAAFGAFHRLRKGARSGVVYAFVLLPMMFVTFWMGMTGFINALTAVPPAVLALLVAFRSPQPATASVVSRPDPAL